MRDDIYMMDSVIEFCLLAIIALGLRIKNVNTRLCPRLLFEEFRDVIGVG